MTGCGTQCSGLVGKVVFNQRKDLIKLNDLGGLFQTQPFSDSVIKITISKVFNGAGWS